MEFELLLLVILTFIVLALVGITIYLFIKVTQVDSSTSKSITEIKSKIGSIIRAVNNVNKLEYQVDVSQQKDINKMKYQTL